MRTKKGLDIELNFADCPYCEKNKSVKHSKVTIYHSSRRKPIDFTEDTKRVAFGEFDGNPQISDQFRKTT